jgi:hypothetical protein
MSFLEEIRRPNLCKLASVGLALTTVIACGSIEPGEGASTAGTGGTAHAGGGAGGVAGAEPGPVGAGGATDPSGGAPDPGEVAPLLPWNVGNSWTYRVTKNGIVTEKTTVVGELELVGGTGPNAGLMAYHVTTDKDGSDHTESWQGPAADAPERIVRFREQAFGATSGMLDTENHYDPPKLHADGSAAHTVKGASWVEEYAETSLPVGMPANTHSVSDRWTVISDSETVKVPAGSFTGVIHLRKAGNSTKDYWYARGIGKLKETGTQTEELSAYTIVP